MNWNFVPHTALLTLKLIDKENFDIPVQGTIKDN